MKWSTGEGSGRPRRVVRGIAVTVFLLAFPATAQEADGRRQAEQRAVALARESRFEESVALLRGLLADREEASVRANLVVALGWAGRHGEALEAAGPLDLEAAPVWAVEAVARSLRHTLAFDEAIPAYRVAVRRFPDCRQCRLGLALSLADAGNTEGDPARLDEAAATAELLVAEAPGDTEVLSGAAYVYRLRFEHFKALALYERILALDPDADEIFRLRVLTVAELGAPFLATKLAAERPEALTDADRRRWLADRAARAVTWAVLPPEDEAEPHAGADRALELVSENLVTFSAGETELLRRSRFDRSVALVHRQRTKEAIAEYESLLAEGVTPPPYATKAVADAYLFERQPERAAEMYREAAESLPEAEAFEARIGLFWALMESDRYREAVALVDRLAAEEPPWRHYPGLGAPQPNVRKSQADVTAALARAYGSREAEAQRRLEALLREGPLHTEVRQTLAGVFLWRGWPRRALEEYDVALSVEPESVYTRIGRTAALEALGRFPAAAAELAKLVERNPGNPHVRRLDDSYRRAAGWSFSLDSEHGNSDGEQLGSGDDTVEAYVYGPRLRHRLRPYLRYSYSAAEYREGHSSYERVGLGLRYTLPGVRISAVADRSLYGAAEDGLTLAVDAQPNDRWSLGGSFASFSTDVRLRARIFGITGRSAGFSAAYTWNERRRLRLGLTWVDLSDGNLRRSALVSYDQRLLTRHGYFLDGTASFYTSAASQPGGPYFNPERDRSWSWTTTQEVAGRRRGERALSHRVVTTLSSYWQMGFGSHLSAVLGYEQILALSPDVSLRYGATWTSRVFDGHREERVALSLSTSWSWR